MTESAGARIEAHLRARLGARLAVQAAPRPQDRTARVAPADLPEAIEALLAGDPEVSLATSVACDETATPEGSLVMRYIFEPSAEGGSAEDAFLTLEVPLDPDQPELPSITPRVPAAAWHEREARDLMGILPVGHPDPRSLVLHDDWPAGLFPLRKSFEISTRPPRAPAPEFPHLTVEGAGVFEVPVGPIHAGIIEPGHFRASVVGDIVLHFEVRLFYTHRGMEKLAEGKTAIDAFHVAERTCGVCSVSHGLGFAEAAEAIAGIEVPPRASAIRTLALELERLYNHVGDIGNICAGASFLLGNAHGLRVRERLQATSEIVSGNRFLRGLVVPGGVRSDLTPEIASQVRRTLADIEPELTDLADAIERSPSLLDRLDGTGVLATRTAIDLAATGVAARASGVDRDARRDHPHAAFATESGLRPPLEIPIQSAGDVHARLAQRVAEAKVSIRIARTIVDGLPAGAFAVAFPERLPPGRTAIRAIETPRGEAVHWLRSDAAGLVDRWRLRSPSYSNWPIIPFSLAGVIVPDFPLVNKSFELCYSCTDR